MILFLPLPKPRNIKVMPATAPADQSNVVYTSLVDVLVSQGKLTSSQADDIALEQVRSNKDPNQILEERRFVSETDLTQAKSIFYHVPYADLSTIGASPEALAQVSDGIAKMYQMLPFALDRASGELSIAMADPLDLSAIEFVERKSGLKIKPYIAPPSEIEKSIAERYAQSLSSEVSAALKESSVVNQANVLVAGQTDQQISAGEVVRDAPIAKIVETVLTFALKSNASDIHIEAMEDKTRVRYRIDGILQEKLVLPKSMHEAVVSRIKILSNLKIDEKRQPQDGRFTFRLGEEEVDLRVSTLPTVHGEKVVMRLLKKSENVPTLTDLGMRGSALNHVQNAIQIPHGIILVTGPTGSGKTTTLYSVLDKINRPEVNIVTLEDPVEYQMEGINQVQVNPQAGLTFASGLRSFLRQDPNIIMVGEIRDEETANLAIQASLTGHLVFSTIHTNSAAGALPRLLDMNVEPFLLASSMTLAMGQRVPRKINPEMVEDYHPDEAVIADIEKVLGPFFKKYLEENKLTRDTVTLKRKRSDLPPNQSEYRGRTGVFEVLPINDHISKMILEKKSAAEIEKAAMEEGMLLMKQDGYLKALEGITTLEEVLRVAQI